MNEATEWRPFTSIPEAVFHHARFNCASSLNFLHPALSTISYEELWKRSGSYATALAAQGVRPGDRVALSMSSTPETVIAVVALMRLGATLVPLYHRSVFRTGGPDGVSILNALRASRARLCFIEERNLPFYQSLCAEGGMPVALSAIQALTEARSGADSFVERRFDDEWPVILQFTAGSTSTPKGIYITQGNMISTLAAIHDRIASSSSDRVFSWLPLYHDFGLIGSLLCSMYVGVTLFLDSPYQFIKNPLGWIRGLSHSRATITTAPQFAFNLCLARSQVAWDEVEDCDLSSLRLAFNGAECVHFETCRRFEQQFARLGLRPNVIQPCYGLAENCLAVTMRRPQTEVAVRHFSRASLAEGEIKAMPAATPETVTLVGNGTPAKGTEIRIRSADGADLPTNLIGDIYVGGLAAAALFADSDGELRPSSQDGFLATGDIGALVDGELYVIGRSKEILKKGGRTFIPSDIENSLGTLASIWPGGVAAINIYDAANGSEELIIVVEASRRLSAAATQSLLNQIRLLVLREFQLPVKDIVITPLGGIPRTTSGKIRRPFLRDAYLGGTLPSAAAQQTDSRQQRRRASSDVP